MNKSVVWLAGGFILAFGLVPAFGQNVSEEAKRHFDRGAAAMEMAKTRADYDAAIKEFEQAAKLAPDWPDAFYNLGLAQEGAEKFADAVRSYRQYLRLAPNADDAEEVKSLINKLEYQALPELEIAKGFMGIPWGANPEQVNEAMEAQGYRNTRGRGYSFQADIAGAPFELHYYYENYSFYSAESFALYRSPSPQVAQALLKLKVNELTKEYGSPSNHRAETMPSNDGGSSPYEFYEWKLVDQRTSDTYSIKVSYELGGTFSDTEKEEYFVSIHYQAESLYERLKNKGTSIDAEKKEAVEPPKISDEQHLLNSSLMLAVRDGDKDRVETLIATGADVNAKYGTGKGITPLHSTVSRNHKDMIDLLIAKGADINAKGVGGWTPLHIAAEEGLKEAAELLIAKGADINAKDEFGMTPLQKAIEENQMEIVALLKKHGAR